MGVLKGKNRCKLIWLAALLSLPILLAGCGGGVSEEGFNSLEAELQAAQGRVQSLEARLDRGAAIQEVLHTMHQRPPWGEAWLEFIGLIQASD